MLEDDVDALASWSGLPDLALEAVGLVVDDEIGAERLGLLTFLVVADGGDRRCSRSPWPSGSPPCRCRTRRHGRGRTRQARAWHCRTACAGPCRRPIGAQAAPRRRPPSAPCITSRSGRLINSRAKPSMMEAHASPATFSQRLSRPSRQALQWPQVSRAVHRHRIALGGSAETPSPTATTSPAASAPDRQRHLALGEGHAAPAPDVDDSSGRRHEHGSGPRRERAGAAARSVRGGDRGRHGAGARASVLFFQSGSGHCREACRTARISTRPSRTR
jgi:hypothetical protein